MNGDIKGLSEIYDVRYQDFNWSRKGLVPVYFFRQLWFLILNFRKAKVYVASFAGYQTFLPALFSKVFGKKLFIVLNGSESVGIKELNYGSHLKPVLTWFCKFSFSNATELWPVSESLIAGRNHFLENKLEYGIKVSFPKLSPKYTVIPNGFFFEKWPERVAQNNPLSFITVISSYAQARLKGVDLILELANHYPDVRFTIVGDVNSEFQLPENMTFVGRVTQTELVQLFNEHRYYLQFSAFEGFGCSLCEAMLSGCIPIGSNVNAIPTIIANSGAVIEHKRLEDAVEAIEHLEMLSDNEKKSKSLMARKSIMERYSIDSRLNQIQERIQAHK